MLVQSSAGFKMIAAAALLILGAARAQSADSAFNRDSAGVIESLAASARGGVLPVFGNVPPGTMTDAQRQALVESLPLFAGERDGRPVDAVNLVFVGSEAKVKALLEGARWTAVPSSLKESIGDVLRGRLKRFPPFSRLFIARRPQAMNWNRPVSFESRHHFRVWLSALAEPRGRAVWPTAGTFDRRIRWDPVPDHVADPCVDEERAYIQASLAGNPLIARMTLVPSPKMPHEWTTNRQRRSTDGRVLVVELVP